MKAFTTITFLAALITSASALLCTPSQSSPDIDDCWKAYNKLPKPAPPGKPVACILVYADRWKLAEEGTCRIEGFSEFPRLVYLALETRLIVQLGSGGGAACIDRAEVRRAVQKVLKNCEVNGLVEGGAQTSGFKGGFEGVEIVKAG